VFNKKKESYRDYEKMLARAIDYDIGEDDFDLPKPAILKQKHAKIGLYIKLAEKLIAFITCFFIISGVIHQW